MEVRVSTLESKKTQAPAKPAQKTVAPKKVEEDDDDDVDLFGSESEVNINI